MTAVLEHAPLPLAPRWRDALPRLGLPEQSDLPLSRLAAQLATAGERAAAADAYRELLEGSPDDIDALERLAAVLSRLGREEEAIAVHRRIVLCTCERLGVPVEERPAVVAFELAALGVEAPPPAPPGAYVAATFDAMAPEFDRRLRTMLRYCGPELVALRLARARGEGRGALDVCDAGCGTGLLGPLLRPHARSLTGVDLSPKMLDKARERGVYDALATADLGQHLAASPGAYDVITAADVLVYIGDVTQVFAAAAGALRPGGLFIVTAELCEGEGYELILAGRYAHSGSYLRAAATLAGFTTISIEEEALRTEIGKAVRGWVAAFEKP
jgi:predicted TPR repeat methyltransferase